MGLTTGGAPPLTLFEKWRTRQLDTLAGEAGLDLVELIGSGMRGKELLEFVMDKHKRAKAVVK